MIFYSFFFASSFYATLITDAAIGAKGVEEGGEGVRFGQLR